jgi:isopenicillin N synthase-like dioxygenase
VIQSEMEGDAPGELMGSVGAHGGLPEIDLAGALSGAGEGRRAVVEAVAEAWRAWGAFVVVNHGVARAVVEGAREQGRRVFALPMERKLQARRAAGEFAGYGNGAGSRTTQSADFGSESFRVGFPGSDTAAFAHKLWPGNQAAPFW